MRKRREDPEYRRYMFEYRKKRLRENPDYRRQCYEAHKRYEKRQRKENAEQYYKGKHRAWQRCEAKWQAKALELLGPTCVLCGATPKKGKRRRTVYHEIHGKKHPAHLNYIITHPEDFVTLCQRCHITVHALMTLFNLTWEGILNLRRNAQKDFVVEKYMEEIE